MSLSDFVFSILLLCGIYYFKLRLGVSLSYLCFSLEVIYVLLIQQSLIMREAFSNILSHKFLERLNYCALIDSSFELNFFNTQCS